MHEAVSLQSVDEEDPLPFAPVVVLHADEVLPKKNPRLFGAIRAKRVVQWLNRAMTPATTGVNSPAVLRARKQIIARTDELRFRRR